MVFFDHTIRESMYFNKLLGIFLTIIHTTKTIKVKNNGLFIFNTSLFIFKDDIF